MNGGLAHETPKNKWKACDQKAAQRRWWLFLARMKHTMVELSMQGTIGGR